MNYSQATTNEREMVTTSVGSPIKVSSVSSLSEMSTVQGFVGEKPVKVLRDTGCSGVIVSKDLVPESAYTGRSQTMVMVDYSSRVVPEVKVSIDTPYYKGEVLALCVEKTLVGLIIGNIPGARERNNPDINWVPALAVKTRAQAKGEGVTSKLKTPSIIDITINPEQVSNAQKEDVSLTTTRSRCEANLTLKPVKCFIGFGSIECLGHMVSEDTLQPCQDKINSILHAERPTTKKQVRSFLGLVGFYRQFIKNFSELAAPSTELTKKGQRNQDIKWGESQEKAFNQLKKALVSKPILKMVKISKPFTLQVDASDLGIGAIVLQEENGKKVPVAYASRKLKQSERSYAVIEKECLALVWAVQKFSRYLYGTPFTVETGHCSLKYLNEAKLKNARLMRWALTLQPYRIHINAIKGSENVGADYLSRV